MKNGNTPSVKVCGFGSSWFSNRAGAEFAKELIHDQQDERRFIVVGCPSSQFGRTKVKDILNKIILSRSLKTDVNPPLRDLRKWFKDLEHELGLKGIIDPLIDRLLVEINIGQSDDFILSIGEFICAKLVAEFLPGFKFIDAVTVIHLASDHQYQSDPNDMTGCRNILEHAMHVVIPGCYGMNITNHKVKRVPFSGVSFTGWTVASLVHAKMYESFPSVEGMMVQSKTPILYTGPMEFSANRNAILGGLDFEGPQDVEN